MAQSCANSLLIWDLLIACFFVHYIVTTNAEFHTFKHYAERNSDSVSFLAIGDWGREGNFNQSRVATQMGEVGRKLGIDFVISTGDNFYDNGLKSVKDPLFANSFTKIYTAKSLQKPWYTVLGNHDYLGSTEAQLSKALQKIDSRWRCKRNFMVAAGPADIIFIDTTPFVNSYFTNPKNQSFNWNQILPRANYTNHLRNDLNLTLKKSKAKWKIVIGHHTIRSIGHHGDTQEIVDQLLPVLEAHGVDMYINGHDHCLQHLSNTNGTMQFLTSGGGSKAWKQDIHQNMHNGTVNFYYDGQGFVSVKLTPKKGTVVFYDVTGKVIHYRELKPYTRK